MDYEELLKLSCEAEKVIVKIEAVGGVLGEQDECLDGLVCGLMQAWSAINEYVSCAVDAQELMQE